MKGKNNVKPPRATEKKAKAWARAIVDAVREGLQERYHFAVDLGIGLGLRQGEAFGLAEEDFDFEAGVVHVRRQLRWDIKGRPYFCLPKGGKMRDIPFAPNFAIRTRDHFRRFPSTACTLPWRNPEVPTTALEERQRKPITVNLVLTTSHGNRIYYRTWNDKSWKPALAAAGLIEPVSVKVRHDGTRCAASRSTPRRARTCSTSSGTPTRACSWRRASPSSACRSGSGTRRRRSPSTTTLTSCPARDGAASPPWTRGWRPLGRLSLRSP
jgi:hypothetical protein